MDSEDGSSFFIPTRLALALGFREDQELDEVQVEAVERAVKLQAAKEKALRFLAMREHSRLELQVKLIQREFDVAIVRQALDELADGGFVSDRRFAESFIASRQRKSPEGRSVLEARLREHGIDRSVAQAALDQWFSQEGNEEEALRAALRKLERTAKHDVDIERKLRMKGFSLQAVRSVLAEEDTQE